MQALHMAIDLPGSLQAISIAEVVGSFLAIPSLMKSVEAEIVQRIFTKKRRIVKNQKNQNRALAVYFLSSGSWPCTGFHQLAD